MQQHRKAKSVCIAVLFCLLAAECTALVQQYRSGPRGPIRAVENHRETDAKAEYLMHTRGNAAPARLAGALQRELDAALSAYRAGTASYEETTAAIRALQSLGEETLTGQAERALQTAAQIESARQAYAAAQKAEQSGRDDEAIRQYRLVTDDAPACYQAAKAALPAAEARFRDAALAAAEQSDADADYAAEIAGLEQALETLPDDGALLSAYTKAVTRRTYTLRHTAMQKARSSADNGTYSDAFAALGEGLSALPDDELLLFAKQNLRARYLLYVKEQTAKLADENRLNEAGALLSEAETLFPGTAELQAVRQNLNAYQPQKLSVLEAGEPNEWFRAEQTLTDRRGKEYTADGNLYYSFDQALTGRRSASAEFALDGQYNLLTLTAAPLASYTAENSVILEIYGDGRLLTSFPFDRDAAALHTKTDVTGVKTLRLRVYPLGVSDLQNAGVLVADGAVRKAGAGT